jgi:GNAT superfamily N-acetyltransferase
MTAAFTVRLAQVSDADAIVALTEQLGYKVEPAAVADRLSRLLARTDHQVVVAESDGRAVGWIHVALTECIDSGAFVTVGGLVVDREYRKRGIGRRLLAYAEEWAIQRGCTVVRLSSSARRTEAHAFYRRAGYANLKTQYSFAKSLGASGANALAAFVPDVT